MKDCKQLDEEYYNLLVQKYDNKKKALQKKIDNGAKIDNKNKKKEYGNKKKECDKKFKDEILSLKKKKDLISIPFEEYENKAESISEECEDIEKFEDIVEKEMKNIALIYKKAEDKKSKAEEKQKIKMQRI